jgi:hypothetical protein
MTIPPQRLLQNFPDTTRNALSGRWNRPLLADVSYQRSVQ